MGMRKYKRQIAKARLTALGVERVNRKMRKVKDGIALWRVVLIGKTGKEAETAQMRAGFRAARMRKGA